MDKTYSTKDGESIIDKDNVFFSRSAKYLVSPDAKAIDLYE